MLPAAALVMCHGPDPWPGGAIFAVGVIFGWLVGGSRSPRANAVIETKAGEFATPRIQEFAWASR